MLMRNENGQLLFPMISVLFLFGIFWVIYVLWCREIYWKMRMDASSDLVALSAAREEAAILNYMATCQWVENFGMQKAKIVSEDVAHMQVEAEYLFSYTNNMLKLESNLAKGWITVVAEKVGNANGASLPAFPTVAKDFNPKDDFNLHLKAHTVLVIYMAELLPVDIDNYATAFYSREPAWGGNNPKAQPPHESRWTLCHESYCSTGRAHLWLDSTDAATNGGFPADNPSILRGIGIQSFYPQFNARLISKK